MALADPELDVLSNKLFTQKIHYGLFMYLKENKDYLKEQVRNKYNIK